MNWIFFVVLAAAVLLLWLGAVFLVRRRRSAASLLLLLVLVAACGAPPAQSPAPASPSPTPVAVPPTDAPGQPILVLAGGTLVDGNGGPPMPDAVLMIRGKRILAAGRRANVTIPPGATVIDVAGATILPGFINAHVHAGYNAANLKAWAQGGVTAVRDLGVAPWDDAFARRDALLADPANARLVAAGPLVTVPGGYPMVPWGMAGLAVASPQDAISQTNRLLDAGADIIKIALDSGGSFGRQIPILSPQEAAAIVQTAHARGARVSAHVLQTADLARALDAGVDDIAHMVEDALTDALIGRMVAAGTYWVPTLELWQRVGLSQQARLPGKQPVTNLGRFVAAGGLVALGTDYADYAAEFDLGMPVTEIELMAEAGMTPMQIIVAATKNAATVCGLDRELGTLEPGKLADVLVVDGDPLTDVHALTQTRLVLRDGVIIMQKAAPRAKAGGVGAVRRTTAACPPEVAVPPGKALFLAHNFTRAAWDVVFGPYTLRVPGYRPGEGYATASLAFEPATYRWQAQTPHDNGAFISDPEGNVALGFTAESGDLLFVRLMSLNPATSTLRWVVEPEIQRCGS